MIHDTKRQKKKNRQWSVGRVDSLNLSTHLVCLVRALVVGVGLDGRDVGVHQNHLDALLLQGLDRLSCHVTSCHVIYVTPTTHVHIATVRVNAHATSHVF